MANLDLLFFFFNFIFYLWLFLVMESSLKCEVCCTPHHGSEFWKILQQNKNIMLWMWIFTLACAVINSLCKGRFLLQWLNFKCNERPYRFIRTYKAELCNSPLSKYYICTYTILCCMCFYTLTSTWWQCSCRYTCLGNTIHESVIVLSLLSVNIESVCINLFCV